MSIGWTADLRRQHPGPVPRRVHLRADEPIGAGDWRWVGESGSADPGGIFEARICGPGIAPQLNRERHHTGEQVRDAMAQAGLELLAALGQREVDGQVFLDDPPDEWRHVKTVYIGRAAR